MHDPVFIQLFTQPPGLHCTVHCPLVACLGWVDNETSDTPLHAAAVIRMGGYYVVGKGKL